jgi:TRAP-type C4-dicarboxylate transport system substrate-binding protein
VAKAKPLNYVPIALALIAMVACGKSSDESASVPAASEVRTPAHKRRIATLAPPGTPWMRILNRGAGRVADATEDRVQVEFFFGGVQGDELDMVRKMKLGQLDGAALTSVGLGMIYPGIRVLQLPGMYDSVEELDYVRERAWPYFQQKFREQGFELRDSSDVGWVHLLSVAEIKSIRDLRSSKMWLWKDDPVTAKILERLGVDGVPLGVPDVLPALETKRVDAVYGSPLAAVALQWYTEVRYLTPLRISYGIGAMVMRREAWDASSDADKLIEARISRDTALELVERIRKDNARALDAMSTGGVKIVEPDGKLAEQLGAVNQDVWNDLVGDLYSQHELDMILAYRAEFRERGGCPSLVAQEHLHAVLALIEHGKPSAEVEQRLDAATSALANATVSAEWTEFAQRTSKAVAAYKAGNSEAATIDEATLRMEFQDSPCFVKDVHDAMHQRLGM